MAPVDKRKSPRRLERHPIYVLNITLPSTDVDASYEPKKGVLGYKVGRVQRWDH
jgi:DNA mismatch repair protein MLH3